MASKLDILTQFEQALSSSPDMTPPVVAIKILVELVAQSKANTISEMSSLIRNAMKILTSKHKYSIPASAGCTLFNLFATKVFTKNQCFENAKQILVTQGIEFVDSIEIFREKIAVVGSPFIQDDAVVLIHSYSRVVMRLLQHAASENKRFLVYVTESRPSDSG
ncbi:translation initiation factor eIF-2B subunit alpha, partial [Coelomomyces lativittatus]